MPLLDSKWSFMVWLWKTLIPTYGSLPWGGTHDEQCLCNSIQCGWTISSWMHHRDSFSHAEYRCHKRMTWKLSAANGRLALTSKVIHDIGSSSGITVSLTSFKLSFSSSNSTVKILPGGVQVPIIKWWSIFEDPKVSSR